MITLWLVRHGLTDWNVEKRYQGHSDIPLNTAGQIQAEQIAQRLADERVHAIISSDLSRAAQTAHAIVSHHKRDIVYDARLREANFGIFEGLRYMDVMEEYPRIAEAWFADPDQPPDGGEKLSDIAERVQQFMGQLLDAYPRKRLVLVGHDGALRLLLCERLGLPHTEYWRFNLAPGSLTQVNVYPGGSILVRLNDIGHQLTTE